MPRPQIRITPGQADIFALHQAMSQDYPFLLESRLNNPDTGRYSLLLGECDLASVRRCTQPEHAEQFLDQITRQSTALTQADAAPFVGGWFVFLAYEFAQGLLPHLDAAASQDSLGQPPPIALAVYCAGAIVVDHLEDRTWLISEAQNCDAHAAALLSVHAAPSTLPRVEMEFTPSSADTYRDAVSAAVEYIASGDIYQANLSRRWQGQKCDAGGMLGAYAQLREHNAATFAASVQWPDLVLASASPERLFCIHDGLIETRPIAGTRARQVDPQHDSAMIEELLAHPKEQAEHIMLVDLERNDLGRISEAGSVRVTELMGIESYASVHHIVSNVIGRPRADLSLHDVLSAVFPGGTITGCPKIRCMQIIAELEQMPRGAYTGSLGYISNCGRMDFNILIRTLVLQDGHAQFHAGAGIVADSQPDLELAETHAKAAGIMRALSV